MTKSPMQVVHEFVAEFVDAWPNGDAPRVADFFSENATYHNGPLKPVRGRSAIVATIGEFMALGGTVSVDMLNVVADDRVVMTERLDHFVVDGKRFSLPVMGTFEIADGQITSWRDYFDLSQFASFLEPVN